MEQVENIKVKSKIKKSKQRKKQNAQMQKARQSAKLKSIKRTFLWYLPLCVAVAYLGAYGIGMAANELQVWYETTYSDINYQAELEKAYEELERLHQEAGIIDIEDGLQQEEENYVRIEYIKTANGVTLYDVRTIGKFASDNPWYNFVYAVISYGQGVLMVGWVLLCVLATGIIFYKRELETPIGVLMDASEKISENCLEFEMKPVKPNELGQLCQSFEVMRQALYENNRELWHTLEERKRLNAAFSHDIRTPLSVLKGYQEMLQNYIPEGKFSKEQLLEMIETMGAQIQRLENYTQKMSAVQKLEDIVPERSAVQVADLVEQLKETGKLLAGNLEFELRTEQNIPGITTEAADTVEPAGTAEPGTMPEEIFLDRELFLEVFENLVSNAARFANSRISARLIVFLGGMDMGKAKQGMAEIAPSGNERMTLVVEDDGPGFSEEALHRATDPFYGSEKDGKVHFGLGLYICKTICEKHGGELKLENRTAGEQGGIESGLGSRVIATFDTKNSQK